MSHFMWERQREREMWNSTKNVLLGEVQLKGFIFFSLLFPFSHGSLWLLCSKAPSHHLPSLISITVSYMLLQKPLDCPDSPNSWRRLCLPSSLHPSTKLWVIITSAVNSQNGGKTRKNLSLSPKYSYFSCSLAPLGSYRARWRIF